MFARGKKMVRALCPSASAICNTYFWFPVPLPTVLTYATRVLNAPRMPVKASKTKSLILCPTLRTSLVPAGITLPNNLFFLIKSIN